jgi:hypothetical protein
VLISNIIVEHEGKKSWSQLLTSILVVNATQAGLHGVLPGSVPIFCEIDPINLRELPPEAEVSEPSGHFR